MGLSRTSVVSLAVGCLVAILTACTPSKTGLVVPGDDSSLGGGGNGNQGGGGGENPGNGSGGLGGGRPPVGTCDPPETLKELGLACGCHDECDSGSCVDGVCCSSSCEGTCQACNVPGKMGNCSPVPAGMAPVVAGQCKRDDVSSCRFDGTCDGNGGCRRYPDGTPCEKGMCDGASVKGAKTCSDGACKMGSNVICAPFGCDGEQAQCFKKCTGNSECAPGQQCKDGSCGKKILGAQCMGNTECESGFCADGVCCNTKCDGGCLSCNQPEKMGECAPVAKDKADPHGVCKDNGATSCGTSGVCDGQGGCAKYGAGTVCRPQRCEGANQVSSSTCDGMGACKPGAQVSCPPYTCSGNACVRTCTNTSQCTGGNVCINGSCGKRGLGQKCEANSECGSNFCVDGVCCDSACNGQCRFCASSQAPGRCVNVPASTPDPRVAAGVTDPARVCTAQAATSCGRNGMCNGNGGCQLWPNNTQCAGQSCAANTNTFSPARLCDGNGTCRSQSSITCSPFKCNGNICGNACGSNNDCVAPNLCMGGTCGLKPPGALCSNDNECGSSFCRQGVCCQSDCRGSCFSCALQASRGTCTAVAAGGVDPAGTCKDDGVATCDRDGTCDGTGKCRLYASGQVCSPATCSNGTAVARSTCDGGGNCVGGSMRQCGGYKCNVEGTACYESCIDSNQCVTNQVCIGNTCGKKPNGGQCTDNIECQSSQCVEGFCCNSACDALCKSCAVAGSEGTCSNVKSGGPDVAGRCTIADPATCGNNGSCNGSGACAKYTAATTCRNQSCPSGASTETQSATCDGNGTCPAVQTSNCGTFKCDPQANSCLVGCSNNDQCVSPNTCEVAIMSCGLKAPGASCQNTTECQAGSKCVEGVCCAGLGSASACAACQTCNGSVKGTCTPLPAGANGACAPAVGEHPICGTQAVCAANGTCAGKAPAGTGCGASCASANEAQSSTCDGNGGCVVTSTITCPGFLTCENGACRDSCVPNAAHCVGGKVCLGNICVEPKKALGEGCNTPGECESSNCQDGVCCNGACNGPCEACNASGICTATAAGQADPLCNADATGNQCNYGICGANNACAAATCGSSSTCSNGALTGNTCNGTNMCAASGSPMPCPGNFLCADGNTCRTSCTQDDQCAAGFFCQTTTAPMNTCQPRKPKGDACTRTGQCGPTLSCSQSVCCTSACSGQCQSCNLEGTVGECTTVPAGGNDPSMTCTASGAICGQTGKCGSGGACQFQLDGKCGAACVGNSTVELHCNGAGGCDKHADPMDCDDGSTCVEEPSVQCVASQQGSGE